MNNELTKKNNIDMKRKKKLVRSIFLLAFVIHISW